MDDIGVAGGLLSQAAVDNILTSRFPRLRTLELALDEEECSPTTCLKPSLPTKAFQRLNTSHGLAETGYRTTAASLGDRAKAALDAMILAVDVDYRTDGGAVAAGMLLENRPSDVAERTVIRRIAHVSPYRPGLFFERELPCILDLLSDIEVTLQIIIVDGYVWLGVDRRAGLGARLFKALDHAVPVVGVAKMRFKDTPPRTEIFRGGSSRPLFVTAV